MDPETRLWLLRQQLEISVEDVHAHEVQRLTRLIDVVEREQAKRQLLM